MRKSSSSLFVRFALCAVIASALPGCFRRNSDGTSPGDPALVTNYLYSTNQDTNDISVFQLDNITRAVTALGTFKTGPRPMCSYYDGLDNALFVGCAGDNNLYIYKVLPSGALELRGKHAFEGPVTAITGTGNGKGTDILLDALVGDTVHPFSVTSTGTGDVIIPLPSAKTGPGNQISLFNQEYPYFDGYVTDTVNSRIYPFRQSPGSGVTAPEGPMLVSNPVGLASFKGSNGQYRVIIGSNFGVTGSFHNYLRGSFKNVGSIDSTLEGTFDGVSASGAIKALAVADAANKIFTIESSSNYVGQYYFDYQTGKMSKVSGTVASAGSDAKCLISYFLTTDRGDLYLGNGAGEIRHYRLDPGVDSLKFINTVSGGGRNISSLAIASGFDAFVSNPLVIPTVLPPGQVGSAYEQALVTLGGRSGFLAKWSLTDGALPPGLNLSEDAAGKWSLIGNPTTAGTSTFTLTATEGDNKASKSFTVQVSSTSGGGGGGGGGPTARFLNLDVTPADASLIFHLGSLTFGATSVGSVSPPENVTIGSPSWFDVNDGGATVQSGTYTLSAGIDSFLFFQASDRAGSVALTAGYPSSGNSGIIVIPATPDISKVDVFVLDGTADTIITSNLGIRTVTKLEVPPGTYRVRFNEAGTTNVYATTSVFTVASGDKAVASATAPTIGAGRTAFLIKL